MNSLNKTSLLIFISLLQFSCSKEIYSPKFGTGEYILTPSVDNKPLINGPSVFGVRPSSPFLYSIPVTGERPISYSVDNLPKGLVVDKTTGVISGQILSNDKKEYLVKLIAENKYGSCDKSFKIKVGDEICLTPPLGWNSWNCWNLEISQENVLNSAKAMIEKGLNNYGWTYINMDDAWQGKRGGRYNAIQPNEKFPDIKSMCDEIHKLGLKVGIYSTPWITSYAGYLGGSSDSINGYWNKSVYSGKKNRDYHRIGKYHFDEVDSKQWADWGIDYLKYDWNPNDAESTTRMAKALKSCGRDIVYSLSNTAPLSIAKVLQKDVNCFRTAGDLKDRWDQKGSHLNIRQQWKLHKHWMDVGIKGGPGHFPDPDMLVVGMVSSNERSDKLRKTLLTPDEQYSHISLWSLWSAPMLIGTPLDMMDDFTFNLLTNSEVLAINQDELAIPAECVMTTLDYEIFVKDLFDGSKAVGLFNLSKEKKEIELDWSLIGIEGRKNVRDVWRQKNIGTYNKKIKAMVPSHGVVLLKIFDK